MFVGHDWGAMVVWQLALLVPERVAGVVGMSVPFLPRPPMPPVQMMRQVLGDSFFYIVYFQEPGVADAELGRDPAAHDDAACSRACRGRATTRPTSPPRSPTTGAASSIASPSRSGSPTGSSRRSSTTTSPSSRAPGSPVASTGTATSTATGASPHSSTVPSVDVPSLFIGGALDPVLLMTPPSVMDGWLHDHRGSVVLAGAGHWVQQEQPDEVNRAIVDFVGDVYGAA